MDIGQLKYLSETCHMSLVGGETFLASQKREMLVPDWLDLCTADKVDQPLLLAAWRGLAADQSWRRRTRVLGPAGISMEIVPSPNIESGRLSQQLRVAAPSAGGEVGPETRGERATTVGVLAAERGQAPRLLLALAQVRMGREEREDERMTTSSSKSSHSRNNQKMQDFTVCLLLFVIAFCFETMTIRDRERKNNKVYFDRIFLI